MNRGVSPCEPLLQRHPNLPSHFHRESWEVGRLVLAQQYRNGPDVLKRCLLLTLLYLIKNVEIENSFATCSPALGRLYRRFGFSVVAKDASAGIGDPFSLIHGRVSNVLRALTESEPDSPQVMCS